MQFKVFFRDLNTDTQLRLSKFWNTPLEELISRRTPVAIMLKDDAESQDDAKVTK